MNTAIDWNNTNTDLKPPVPGAVAVYWIVMGHHGLEWQHKGWLMPDISQ